MAACSAAGAEVLVNGDVDLARELGTGVHLQARQLAGVSARPLPADQRVAASCHTADELRAAEGLFKRYGIPYINTTECSIEEIASRILDKTGVERRVRP